MNSGSCWELSVEHNDAENIFDEPDKKKYGELKKAFAPGLGICSRGQVQKEYFEFEYYYPYLEGRGVTTFEDVYVERQAEKECYIGACDDNRVGVTIIFYLQNMVEYLQVCGTQPGNRHKSSLTLSALSVDGKIILPVSKIRNRCGRTEKIPGTGQNSSRKPARGTRRPWKASRWRTLTPIP